VCEGWMGWDLLVVSCAGGRGRSDGREAMNSRKKKNSRTSKTRQVKTDGMPRRR
jgi:hypothetical protein